MFNVQAWVRKIKLTRRECCCCPPQELPEDCLPGDITEPGELDEMFDEMDANSDGKVTFDEFKAAMQKDSSLQDVVLSSLRPAP